MSSQTGPAGSAIGSANCGTASNATSNIQSVSSTGSSSKTSSKMSIDHQATLDKGLKMKIKRTKPGTKSSEAKHEIVKAIEQQQNGTTSAGISKVCTSDDNGAISGSNSLNVSNIGNEIIGSGTMLGATTAGNRKSFIGSNTNTSSSNTNQAAGVNNGIPNPTNAAQTPLTTKRGNSGHRRDKTKDKSSHSNRQSTEKHPQIVEKDVHEKSVCQCSGTDNAVTTCSKSCVNNELSLAQRLPNSNANTMHVPPGIFTPSDTQAIVSSGTNILDSKQKSTPSTPHSQISGSANAPGPPTSDTQSPHNIKISAHIAAQLAAAHFTNGATLSGGELKASSSPSSQSTKNIASAPNSAIMHASTSTPSAETDCNTPPSTSAYTPSLNLIQASNPEEKFECPPSKRLKHNEIKHHSVESAIKKETSDVCVGTSVGTITEPDCLGPCEPGTSVTLEGIVWHETEGGVLVVNVTWRGKTYVGTLLDCTRHDWAPPRFCDSPTDEFDSRIPKGRGKRGRAAVTPDLSNFTETRSSIYFSHSHVHSKLRNYTAKGGRTSRTSATATTDKLHSGSSVSSGNGGSTPSTSPTAFLPPRTEKRKSKDEPASPPAIDDSSSMGVINVGGISISVEGSQPQTFVNPVTGLNVQVSSKKCKTSPSCPISPVLLECPEQDCSKKYKHANGLLYHQSHAHGNTLLQDEEQNIESDEPQTTPLASPLASANLESEIVSAKQSTSPQLQTKIDSTQKTADFDTVSQTETKYPDAKRSALRVLQPSAEDPSQKISESPILDLESKNTDAVQHGSTAKCGSLRIGQTESSPADTNILASDSDKTSQSLTDNSVVLVKPQSTSKVVELQMSTQGSDSNSRGTNNEDILDTFKQTNDVPEPVTVNCESFQVLNKQNAIGEAGKIKKGRKSPTQSDTKNEKLNTSNTTSRMDVQSPAYSDISDDSTPVNDQQVLEKQNLKDATIYKKSTDVNLHCVPANSGAGHHSSQSPLGGFGVYQFYQQQQFLVQSSADHQQLNKSNIANTGTPMSESTDLSQQTHASADFKKEQTHELAPKASIYMDQDTGLQPQDSNKDLRHPTSSHGSNCPTSVLGAAVINSGTPPKSASHFYTFNYQNYQLNADQSYVPVQLPSSDDKSSRQSADLQSPSISLKDDLEKETSSPNECSSNIQPPQGVLNKSSKPEVVPKIENIKTETINTSPVSHLQLNSKDGQGLGVYTNVYQRHPVSTPGQHLSRDEELRRYYIFTDQHRRQSSGTHISSSPSHPNFNAQREDPVSSANTSQQNQNNPQQQHIKFKSGSTHILGTSGKSTSAPKESPKLKQDEDIKLIKQEGQKPTMETQGPPPPPTSQYFLHPSYIASSPFGFDPNHPLYRNVLMPSTSPYSPSPYHLPLPRYHAPEDLSRNGGPKALDALHHAASQYYSSHKIHELSERALKSPNGNSMSGANTAKESSSSPSNVTSSHPNITSNQINQHASGNQIQSTGQLPLTMTSPLPSSSKSDILQKSHTNVSIEQGGTEAPKSLTNNTSPVVANSVGANIAVGNASGGSATDSRSPPPQRHVHTHHHTHVGLGYPMYPAPYGAAVLASQQAAAVAVINPFPPGPTK